jgi:hypothetical protein
MWLCTFECFWSIWFHLYSVIHQIISYFIQ